MITRATQIVSILLVLFTSTSSKSQVKALPQAPAYAIEFKTDLPATDSPVSIISVTDGDQQVPLGTAIAVYGRWVSKVRIVVRNVSLRTIVSGNATLVFPESGDGTAEHPYVTEVMKTGRPPDTLLRRRDGTMVPAPEQYSRLSMIRIPPGGTMEFQAEIYSNGLVAGDAEQKAAYQAAAGKISRVTIHLNDFFFEDGSMWTGYYYMKPVDPPKLWMKVDASDFVL